MAYNAYDELVTGHPNIKHYWTLDNTPNATVGGVNLTGTTTYDTGIAHAKCATFDGLSEELHTASNIDLSVTKIATVIGFFKWIVYDKTNVEFQFEHTSSIDATNGGFALTTRGDTAGDPIRAALHGAVGYSNASYNVPATITLDDGNWFFLASVYNKSNVTSQSRILYVNGSQVTPNNSADSANTETFDNAVFYLASRGGSTAFSNIAVDGLGIFDTVLTQTEISRFYAAVTGTMLPAKHSNIGLQTYLKTGG